MCCRNNSSNDKCISEELNANSDLLIGFALLSALTTLKSVKQTNKRNVLHTLCGSELDLMIMRNSSDSDAMKSIYNETYCLSCNGDTEGSATLLYTYVFVLCFRSVLFMCVILCASNMYEMNSQCPMRPN